MVFQQKMKKYKLSEEEHIRIGRTIQTVELGDLYPVKRPKAIIDIAPPASGKTGLNTLGEKKLLMEILKTYEESLQERKNQISK